MKDNEYAERFKNTSKVIYENGLYHWMSDYIADYEYVLEIGTGVGYSTLSLIENNHKIISVDRNLLCLSKSIDLLESHGYKAKITDSQNMDTLRHEVTEFFEGSLLDVLLINTDLLVDNNFFKLLTSNAMKFNCITVWQLGGFFINDNSIQKYLPFIFSREMQQICPELVLKYNTLVSVNIEYRDLDWRKDFESVIVDAGKIALENNIYKISKSCLHNEGCLSFVNRISDLIEINDILEKTKSIDIDSEFNFTYLGQQKHEDTSGNGISVLSQMKNQTYYFVASKFTK